MSYIASLKNRHFPIYLFFLLLVAFEIPWLVGIPSGSQILMGGIYMNLKEKWESIKVNFSNLKISLEDSSDNRKKYIYNQNRKRISHIQDTCKYF